MTRHQEGKALLLLASIGPTFFGLERPNTFTPVRFFHSSRQLGWSSSGRNTNRVTADDPGLADASMGPTFVRSE